MNPENSENSNSSEQEASFEIKTGDVLFVTRNLRTEDGEPLLDAEGKQQQKLEDGWEVIDINDIDDTDDIDPTILMEGVPLRNTANRKELKFYSMARLQAIQQQAKADVLSRASSVASEMLGEIDKHSIEIAEEEPRVTAAQAEKIGEEILEAAEVDEPAASEPELSPWSREAASQNEGGYTRENPYIFGMEDRKFITTVAVDGQEVRAITRGVYTDDEGVRQMILAPMSMQDAALFEGKIITKPESEVLAVRKQTIAQVSEQRAIDTDEIARNHPLDDDEAGHAMPMEEVRKLIQEARSQAPAEQAVEQVSEQASGQAPEQETELQMAERFLAETKAELQELYAAHRKVDPGSQEAYSLENKIRYAKEDAGRFAGQVARLKGHNWTQGSR